MKQGPTLELPEYIIRPGIVVTRPPLPFDRDAAPIFNHKEFEKHSFFKKNRNASFIETGTFYGHGVLSAIAVGCVDIHSIEIKNELFGYTSCMLDLLAYHNAYNFEIETYRCNDFYSVIFGDKIRISLYLGDSCEVLPKVLQRTIVKSTFWLDAHYSGDGTGVSEANGDFPIYKELQIIKNHGIKDHTIMIDDVKSFEKFSPDQNEKLDAFLHTINSDYVIERVTKSDAPDEEALIAYTPEDKQ